MMKVVTFETTLGNIKIKVDHELAPISAQNFIDYAESGFYNGTIFHRIIPDFVVQGGGLDAEMNQKKTQPAIENEADNGLKNKRGTLSMARTQAPHSATSQFFINLKDNDFLDHRSPDLHGWGYAVFAEVIEGMDIVDKMAQAKTGNRMGHSDVPVDDIYIENTLVSEA